MSLASQPPEKERSGMRGRTGEGLLQLPVRTGGLGLGRSVDLVVDLDGRRALGLDVLCGDEVMRFVPVAVATLRDEMIEVKSALVLLDEGQRRFYQERATTLSQARGLTVERDGQPLGTLRDVVLGEAFAIRGLLVSGADPEFVPFDGSVRVRDGRRRAPAA
jgi:hypothetical protein